MDLTMDVCKAGQDMDLLPDSSMTQDEGSRSTEPRRRNRSIKQQGELYCAVCGDRAFGYNFGAITCESCKAFFRRNALKAKVLECNFDGSCTLDKYTRKFCTKCRLEKCLECGMKKEWILDDEQLKKRKKMKPRGKKLPPPHTYSPTVKKEPLDDWFHHQQPSTSQPEPMSAMGSYSRGWQSDDTSSTSSEHPSSSTEFPKMEEELKPTPMVPEDVKLLEDLDMNYNRIFDSPYTQNQMQKLAANATSHTQLYNMADGFVRRLIKFCKTVPEFVKLNQEDQIALLKGGIMCIMILRGAMAFNPSNVGFQISAQEPTAPAGIPAADSVVTKKVLPVPNLLHMGEIDFFISFRQLTRGNRYTMLCLFLIEIFSPDRPHVVQKEIVAQAQERFSALLRKHLESTYSVAESKILFPKLLLKLIDLRETAEASSKKASQLDINSMEPLLVEILNLG